MINANELRIGNWVNIIKFVPTQITAGHITSISEGDGVYHPIPLTPEILEKAGFKNIQGDFYQKNNELLVALDSVWWWTNSWEPDGEFGFNALAHWKEIESLHQLQNLYFALTGTELTINL